MYEGGGVLLFGFVPGHWELLLIGGVILLIFFGGRIPEVMRSLGKGVTQFKKGLREGDADEDGGDGEAPQAKSLPPPKKDAEIETLKKTETAEVPSKRKSE